jgi:excisionase family DNA binding protein
MSKAIPQFTYLSLAAASRVTSLSMRTIRRAIGHRRLAAHRIGRLIRIEEGELRRWIEADGAAARRSGRPRSRS